MSHVLEKDDKRDQLLVDNDLRVTWKLTCGAIAGATAQSGKQSHYRQYIDFDLNGSSHGPRPLLFFFSASTVSCGFDVGRGIIPHTKYVRSKPEGKFLSRGLVIT